MVQVNQAFTFLYSQDLSNCTTQPDQQLFDEMFLYSQDLSNCTTRIDNITSTVEFLYSQDLSKCTTECEGMEVEEVELVLELCCFEWSQNYYLYDITEYLKK